LNVANLSLGSGDENSSVRFKATRLGVIADRLLWMEDYKVRLYAGFGGGLMVWRFIDPSTGEKFQVEGINNQTIDFAASELFFSGKMTLQWMVNEHWSLNWRLRGDYLTGLGAEFADDVNSSRGKILGSLIISVGYSFGLVPSSWASDENWSSIPGDLPPPPPGEIEDGDGDGVPDETDRCLDTPIGIEVDRFGCARDSDGDGVSDNLDDCPDTEFRARSQVDIHGCPIDSDFDGIADYRDDCPNNPVGAAVDAVGCPMDSDGDGVPDGLDDCPHTLVGVEVDPNGCIDLSMLAEPMILNIRYVPGSFEIDPRSRERIQKLASMLSFVPAVKMEINGYTDNIGTALANRELSLKRANRVRDFLVANGVDTDRIKVFGKGEANFVASNQSAAGREKNRRIEIIFYQ
jgi:outer membrane protein OmpA-like peptidoglycan-associated protein